jgi:hypothetical protein
MRTLTEKYLGGLSVDRDAYEADLAIVDRYQAFSAELLRLSLLAITGYGFLISNIDLHAPTTADDRVLLHPWTVLALIVGAVAFGLSAATALGHRYFATDCITHFVRRLRLTKRAGNLLDDDGERQALLRAIRQEQQSLVNDVDRCRWLLLASCVFLVLGAGCVAFAFASTLHHVMPHHGTASPGITSTSRWSVAR